LTRQYSRVDYDFSNSKNDGEYWKNKIKERYEALGAHVFERYLTDCGSEIIETTFSWEQYYDSITKRKTMDSYDTNTLNENVVNHVSEKYIIGIDIGGTGIKVKVFKIIVNDESNEKYTLYQGKLFITPVNVMEYSFPTLSPEKEGEKYNDAKEFAEYIVNTLLKKAGKYKSELLKKTISIGFCWPGPIKQNRVVSTSGILAKFKGLNNSVQKNEHQKILELNIAETIKNAFFKESREKISVALENDGDAEAIGLTFGKVNITTKNETFESLFKEFRVAIIKAGTGTAGAVVANGNIEGLNEFGKLIVELEADNSKNEGKDRDSKWPVGDANKMFSVKFIEENIQTITGKTEKVTGRDIDLLLKAADNKLFGVLEIMKLGEPNIEWGDIMNKNDTIREEVTLKYVEKEGYKIVTGKADENISTQTWFKLANEPRIKLTPKLKSNSPQTFSYLLEELGKHRITNLGYKDKEEEIKQMCKRMGQHLADVIATLYDIYEIKAVIIAGGPMKSNLIRTQCMEGLKENLTKYLYDFSHEDKALIKEFTKDIKKEDISKCKFFYHGDGKDYSLLGAAISGFDCYVEEQKIAELKELQRNIPKQINNNLLTYSEKEKKPLQYLTEKEAIEFIEKNAARLNVTIDKDGNISKLGAETKD